MKLTKSQRRAKRRQELFASQNYVCAICKLPEDIGPKKHGSTYHIDHCHVSGITRGILCPRCNYGLGHFYDSIESLENAIKYLRKYEHYKIDPFTGEVMDYQNNFPLHAFTE